LRNCPAIALPLANLGVWKSIPSDVRDVDLAAAGGIAIVGYMFLYYKKAG
jgi:hypothetical protein